MNDWSLLRPLVKRSLLLLVGTMVLALTLYFGSGYASDYLQSELRTAQGELDGLRAALAQHQADLGNMQTHIREFQKLTREGLVGKPAREQWVEELSASQERTGLRDLLSYKLLAPQPLNAVAGTPAGKAPQDVAASAPGEPLYHDLELRLKDIHEDELLQLLDDYQRTVSGRQHIQSCSLLTRAPRGLDAVCTLRFFTIEPARAGTDAAPQ